MLCGPSYESNHCSNKFIHSAPQSDRVCGAVCQTILSYETNTGDMCIACTRNYTLQDSQVHTNNPMMQSQATHMHTGLSASPHKGCMAHTAFHLSGVLQLQLIPESLTSSAYAAYKKDLPRMQFGEYSSKMLSSLLMLRPRMGRLTVGPCLV